ncbi:hypothetical protein ACFL1H_05860 [Nanoarchaeota archaeon]
MAAPVTHLFIAMKSFKGDKNSLNYADFLIGSILPDFEFLVYSVGEEHVLTHDFTKRISKNKKFKFILKGMENHLEVDEVVHNYINNKVNEIKLVNPLMVHGMIEFKLNQKVIKDNKEIRHIMKIIKERIYEDFLVDELAGFFNVSRTRVIKILHDALIAMNPKVTKSYFLTAIVWFYLARQKDYKDLE